MIKVKILKEEGYEPAMFGNGLSYGSTSLVDFDSDDWDKSKTSKVIKTLSVMGGGHNKSLESIVVWIDYTAPRYFHQEFDTYRHLSKLSDSTIHTLTRDGLTDENFPCDWGKDLPDELLDYLDQYSLSIRRDFEYIQNYEHITKAQKTILLKKLLPENFMQRRVARVDYMSLRNMILQRRTHLLPEWQVFIKEVLSQVNHPELLPSID